MRDKKKRKPLWRLAPIGATLPFLSGCAASCPIEYVAQPTLPPDELLTPCDVESYQIATNGDLVTAFVLTRAALMRCADKVEGLREWRRGFDGEQ